MPYNLLILPLLGGYILVSLLYATRFQVKRSHGYHLFFWSAVAAVCLTLIAPLIALTIPYIDWLSGTLFTTMGFDYDQPIRSLFLFLHKIIFENHPSQGDTHHIPTHGQLTTAILAFLLGPLLAGTVNMCGKLHSHFPRLTWLAFLGKQRAIEKAIRRRQDSMEVFLSRSLREGRCILVTLRSGKVYAGKLHRNFNPAYDLSSIEMIVECSGYRDPDNHGVLLDSHYSSVLETIRQQIIRQAYRNAIQYAEKRNINDIEKLVRYALESVRLSANEQYHNHMTVIPLREIVTVHPFDHAFYQQQRKDREDQLVCFSGNTQPGAEQTSPAQ